MRWLRQSCRSRLPRPPAWSRRCRSSQSGCRCRNSNPPAGCKLPGSRSKSVQEAGPETFSWLFSFHGGSAGRCLSTPVYCRNFLIQQSFGFVVIFLCFSHFPPYIFIFLFNFRMHTYSLYCKMKSDLSRISIISASYRYFPKIYECVCAK